MVQPTYWEWDHALYVYPLPDALVLGVGTGGTLIGVGQAFREVNPRVRLFAMEPSESRTILCGESPRT